MTLVPQWRKLLLAAHVVASVGALGTDLAIVTLGITGARGAAAPIAVYPAAHTVGAWILAPLALVALGTGLLLGLLTSWGVLRYWWTAIKLTITATLSAVVLFVLVPGLGQAADAATASQAVDDAMKTLLVAGPATGFTLLVVNVVLAIYKPSWRLRSTDG